MLNWLRLTPKSIDILLAVRNLVREKRSRNERVPQWVTSDKQRMWLVVDDRDPKAYASSLRCDYFSNRTSHVKNGESRVTTSERCS